MTQYSLEVLAERVFLLVEAIPPGSVTTYGAVAEAAGCGPRQVARLIQELGGLPWWRLVNVRGELPPSLTPAAREHWQAEMTPLTSDGTRVLLRRALVGPDELLELIQHELPDS